MKIRCTLSVLAVAAMLTTGAACSGKSDESESESDKKDQGETNPADKDSDSPTATPSTVSDAEFADNIDTVRAEIEAGKSDHCRLANALRTNPPPAPGNTDQTKKFVTVYALLMNAVADSIGGETENASVLRDAGKRLEKLAADKNYAAGLLQSKELIAIVTDEEVESALSEFDQMTADCADPEAGPEAGPENGPDGAGPDGGPEAGPADEPMEGEQSPSATEPTTE